MLVLADGRSLPLSESRQVGSWGRLLASLVHGRPRRIELPLADARLRLGHGVRRGGGRGKENALIFFRDGQVMRVLKVALFNNNLARDVRMNRTLAEGLGITPDVPSYDPRFRWALFEYRPAGADDGRPGGRLFFESVAPAYYSFWGVRMRPLDAYLCRHGVALADLNSFLGRLGFPTVSASAAIPHSLIHGGHLDRECYLDTTQRPTLLDWEKVQVAPIACDAMKLSLEGKAAAVEFLERYRDSDTLAPALQVAVVAATRAVASSGKARKYSKLAQSVAPLLD